MNTKGFGLVEFLITLVIIGVISILTLNVVDNKIKKDKEKTKLTDILKKEIIEEIKKETTTTNGGWELMCDEEFPKPADDIPKCSDHKDKFDTAQYIYMIEEFVVPKGLTKVKQSSGTYKGQYCSPDYAICSETGLFYEILPYGAPASLVTWHRTSYSRINHDKKQYLEQPGYYNYPVYRMYRQKFR